VVTAVASAAVLVAIVETPGASQFFGCTPIGPVAWTVVGASTVAGTAAAALASRYWGEATGTADDRSARGRRFIARSAGSTEQRG
jgi:cation-transporting ATPase I